MRHTFYETRCFRYWLEDDGVIHATCILPDADLGFQDAKEDLYILSKITRENKKALMIDVCSVRSATRANREHFASGMRESLTAVAIVAETSSWEIYNRFVHLNHPTAPTQLFRSQARAIMWLQPFLDSARA